jgi:hypothetical protein
VAVKDAAALSRLARNHRRLIDHVSDKRTASLLGVLADTYETLAEEAMPEIRPPRRA